MVAALFAVASCGCSQPTTTSERASAPPAASTQTQSPAPSGPTDNETSGSGDVVTESSCRLKGQSRAKVTLTDAGDRLIATFVGQPIAANGTSGYFVTVFDQPGETGAQLGATFRDGQPEAYFVFDYGDAMQENLTGQASVDGATVVATFPRSAEPLGDLVISQWSAGVSRNGNDVGLCPKDMSLLPFPG